MTYSYTGTESFTVAHARKLAGKVSADMNQCRHFYLTPSEGEIASYQDELVVMLAGGFVDQYEFGFKTSDDRRVVSWRYRVTASGDLDGGRSGGLHAKADISNARWFNFMTYSAAWSNLSKADQEKVKGAHQVNRGEGKQPTDGSGRWVQDRAYGAGGVRLQREEFRPW